MLRITLYLRVGELSPYQTLEGKDGVLRIDYSLTLRGETDEALAVLCERDNRGSCSCPLCIFNDLCGLALHDSDTRVCCAEINADDGTCKNASKMCGIDVKR